MDVTIEHLTRDLPSILERVAKGESFRLVDRGHALALLGPIPTLERLSAGVREGWLTPGTGEPLSRITPRRGRLTIRELIDEDRGR